MKSPTKQIKKNPKNKISIKNKIKIEKKKLKKEKQPYKAKKYKKCIKKTNTKNSKLQNRKTT